MNAASESAPDRGIDCEVDRLDAWLRRELPALGDEMVVERTFGGMSNPTYFLRRGDWQAVLRKQPNAVLMASAHAPDSDTLALCHGEGQRRARRPGADRRGRLLPPVKPARDCDHAPLRSAATPYLP